MSNPSHYETIATAFQTVEIATAVAFASPGETALDVIISINESNVETPGNEFCIIRDEQKIYGYISVNFIFDDEEDKYDGPSDGQSGEYCTPISPDQIVPGTMPLLDLISLFKHHPFFFVLTRNTITHVVAFSDLDQLPVKLCLFALLMALEAELLGIFSSINPQSYLNLLPEGRLQKAQELCQFKYKDRFKNAPPKEQATFILLCTTFRDKVTILTRSPDLFSALPFSSRSQAERFFVLAQDIRNQIAHSDTITKALPTPEEFDEFLVSLKSVTEAITKLRYQTR